MQSRTREPSWASARQSASVRCSMAWSTAPVSGKSLRSSRRIASVESVVVWSSMSRVTVVPALRAARQMVRAFSSAILWPSSGRNWPMALSLTDTSAPRVSPRAESCCEDVEVRRDGRVGLLGVEGVLAEEVEGDPEPVVGERGGRVDGGLGGLAGDVAADDPGRDRHGADRAS